MEVLQRRNAGQPIRDAMRALDISIPDLARKTKMVDESGKGVSPALIGKLVATGPSGRDNVRLRSAWLVAAALHEPLQRLFSMPPTATATVERSQTDGEHRAADDPQHGPGRAHPTG